ncbi:MAG: hypothetical protein WB791_05670 [Waddliaceae bacterium]
MSSPQPREVMSQAAAPIDSSDKNHDELPLESLVLLTLTARFDYLQKKSQAQLTELKERQDNVAELNDIVKAINRATDADGGLDLSNQDELKDLLQKAGDYGVEIQEGKEIFNREERNRLVDNCRMTVDDLNTQNEMQLQTLSRLTNERYEMYQMARTIIKPLHEAKMSYAKAIK